MYAAVDRLEQEMTQIPDATAFLARMAQDLDSIPFDPAAHIGYLVSAMYHLREAGPSWLTPHDHIRIIHDAIGRLDAFTGHITPQGRTDDHAISSDIANDTKPMFLSAIQRERELLQRGEMTPAIAEMVADIMSVFARKGEYYYAVHTGPDREDVVNGVSWRSASFALLYAIDVQRRYDALGSAEKSAAIGRFIEEVQAVLGFSGPPEEAAQAFLAEGLEKNLSSFAHGREGDPPDLADRMIEFVDWALTSSFDGAYSTGTPYFRMISEAFGRHGFPELADKYAARADEAERLARELGLIQAP